ncbi:MAG: LysM peptidoglycan-binding domain-containing protein [Chloroflexi bacterium]|nr:LysM peptidoglycan-binding domain-containing protein [Chloroflexota bacterium]
MVTDTESGPPVEPELRWVKVTGPDALRPLDRHWVRYVRLALLLAAVLIAWRILAWQEDGYRAAASAAGDAALRGAPVGVGLSSQTSPSVTEAAQSGVEIVVLSPTPTATPTPVPTPTPTPAPTPATHTVRAGETLSRISQLYNVPVSVIVDLNDIPDPNNLLVGQRLLLPEGTEVPEQEDAPGPYTVQPGDTLSAIAVAFGVSINDLMAANQISNPDSIFVGQQLRIPGSPG